MCHSIRILFLFLISFSPFIYPNIPVVLPSGRPIFLPVLEIKINFEERNWCGIHAKANGLFNIIIIQCYKYTAFIFRKSIWICVNKHYAYNCIIFTEWQIVIANDTRPDSVSGRAPTPRQSQTSTSIITTTTTCICLCAHLYR